LMVFETAKSTWVICNRSSPLNSAKGAGQGVHGL
jgi:hypothetical protein